MSHDDNWDCFTWLTKFREMTPVDPDRNTFISSASNTRPGQGWSINVEPMAQYFFQFSGSLK